MNRIVLAVISMLILPGVAAAQRDDPFTWWAGKGKVVSFIEGIGIHPRGRIFVETFTASIDEYIYQNDADWYLYTARRGMRRGGRPAYWHSLSHAQVHNMSADYFEEALGDLTWEEYLRRDDIIIKITANGNVIFVLSKNVLHIIEMSSNIVITIDYSDGSLCAPLDGGEFPDEYPPDLTQMLRCYYMMDVHTDVNKVRSMRDAARIKSGVMEALKAVSPFDYEKSQLSHYHFLNPPEIWIIEWFPDDTTTVEIKKLDDKFDTEASKLSSIVFGEHLWREDLRAHETSFDEAARHRAKVVMLHSLERILSTDGKWLLDLTRLWELILMRNLSTLY